MGERAYALKMAQLLDPRQGYFGDKVVSCDKMGLCFVLGQEYVVSILNDTENVITRFP